MTPILQLQKLLHLGTIDADSFDSFENNRINYFKKYHQRFWGSFGNQTRRRIQFRGESLDEWIEPKMIPGQDVKALQKFLHKHGFMPGARVDGVFDYWTLASVRLFQEYVRTVEGIDIGIADGRVGRGTHKHMMRWEENDMYCEWGPDKTSNPEKEFTWSNPSIEYNLWMSLLPKVKGSFLEALKSTADLSEDINLFQLQEVQKFKKTDSLKIDEWTYNKDDIHLIGLRCFQERGERSRGNDDLFVLLMNGMVFKFWGSTDPKPSRTSDGFEPYLLEGQHKYGLSWHKVGTKSIKKVYKALVPYDKGVLVFRDWSMEDNLTEKDIRRGLAYNKTGKWDRNNPNKTINIHWTADGKSNWSAGCQVISGRSYINHKGVLVDCSKYSANDYSSVSAVSKPSVKYNRGAYTFVSDFIYVYASPKQDHVLYTLGRDGAIEQFADTEMLDLLKKQIPDHTFARGAGGEAVIHSIIDKLKNIIS